MTDPEVVRRETGTEEHVEVAVDDSGQPDPRDVRRLRDAERAASDDEDE